MDGVNQSQSSQPAPSSNNAQNQKVSEDQAADFSKRVDKKKDQKGKTDGKEEQSLESLMAERRKNAREALEGKFKDQGERGDGRKDPSELMQSALMDEKGEHAIASVREAQAAEAQLKSIQSVSGPKEINETISKLVDKISVSAKDAVNGSEIRMTLKDNILPGTEIRIQRAGGELTVTMNTTSADSHNFLAQHEASLLKSLNDRFGEKVQVNINMSGEQNDGRSREEYVGEEEEQDDNDDS